MLCFSAIGLKPVLLTGDNVRTARVVASAVGIEEVIAEVLPGEKAEVIRLEANPHPSIHASLRFALLRMLDLDAHGC